MSKKRHALPDPVYHLLVYHSAWLAGSGAWWYVDGADRDDTPRDFDLFVPHGKLPQANIFLDSQAESMVVNGMGGMKARFEDALCLDIWADDVQSYVQKAKEMGFGDIALVSFRPKVVLTEGRDE